MPPFPALLFHHLFDAAKLSRRHLLHRAIFTSRPLTSTSPPREASSDLTSLEDVHALLLLHSSTSSTSSPLTSTTTNAGTVNRYAGTASSPPTSSGPLHAPPSYLNKLSPRGTFFPQRFSHRERASSHNTLLREALLIVWTSPLAPFTLFPGDARHMKTQDFDQRQHATIYIVTGRL